MGWFKIAWLHFVLIFTWNFYRLCIFLFIVFQPKWFTKDSLKIALDPKIQRFTKQKHFRAFYGFNVVLLDCQSTSNELALFSCLYVHSLVHSFVHSVSCVCMWMRGWKSVCVRAWMCSHHLNHKWMRLSVYLWGLWSDA